MPNTGSTRRSLLHAVVAASVGYALCYLHTMTAGRRVIGPVAVVAESSKGVTWKARGDTGATISSVHCPIDRIEGLTDPPLANVGREVMLTLNDDEGARHPLRTPIVDYSLIRTESAIEPRYKVRLRIVCQRVEADTLVSLNDRSHMRHKFLLGRDFLEGRFVVDVSR